MATRGALGGISKAVSGGVRVMELFGAEYVFIETVGIGQSEIDVASQADTVVLVVVPGMGDDIQAEKAGILEVSDIIDVNKADHEDTNRTIRQLKSMLSGQTDPTIISTIATTGEGIPELMAAIENHRPTKSKVGDKTELTEPKCKEELRKLMIARLEKEFADFDDQTKATAHSAENIIHQKTDLESEAQTLFDAYMKWRTQKC
jgi:LAO/AO transport system kinase